MNFMRTDRARASEANRQITKIITDTVKDIRNECVSMFAPSLAAGFLMAYSTTRDIDQAKEQLHRCIPSDPPGMHLALCTIEASEVIEKLISIGDDYTADEFAMAALQPVESSVYSTGYFKTPNDIMDLAATILNVRPGMSSLDLCSGPLSFFIHTAMIGRPGDYTACEMDFDIAAFARFRAAIASTRINVIEEDALRIDNNGKKYDRIFLDPPYGGRRYNDDTDCYPDAFARSSMEWRFVYKAAAMLKDDGVAACIVPVRNLFRKSDEAARRYMMEAGLVQSVIILPEHMSKLTAIKLAIVIVSHENDRMQIIDAAGYAQKSGTMNRIPARAIEYITEIQRISEFKTDDDGEANYGIQYYQSLAKDCIFITSEEAAPHEFVLLPDRYSSNRIGEFPTEPFGTMIESVRRGQPFSKEVLESITSEEQTNTQYLSITDIVDGEIRQPIRYICDDADTKIDPRAILQKGDLLITKAGNPIKAILIREEPIGRIIVSGNIYIIRMNKTMIDPEYVIAYLESAPGKATLKNAAKGMAVNSIALEDIKNIQIPMMDVDAQKKIVAKYKELTQRIIEYRKMIESTQSQLDNILNP